MGGETRSQGASGPVFCCCYMEHGAFGIQPRIAASAAVLCGGVTGPDRTHSSLYCAGGCSADWRRHEVPGRLWAGVLLRHGAGIRFSG